MASRTCGHRIRRHSQVAFYVSNLFDARDRGRGVTFRDIVSQLIYYAKSPHTGTGDADYVLRFQAEFRWKVSPVDRRGTDSIGYIQWQRNG